MHPPTPVPAASSHALLIVDVQNDFCEGGALAVPGGAGLARDISTFLKREKNRFAAIIASADWHIEPGNHFSATPNFRDSWPVHCRAHTEGARLRPELSTSPIDALFHKGQYDDGYSAFDGKLADHDRNDNPGDLDSYLRARSIRALTIMGIATDYCVLATASDALTRGYEVTLIPQLCLGVEADSSARAFEQLERAGARTISLEQWRAP